MDNLNNFSPDNYNNSNPDLYGKLNEFIINYNSEQAGTNSASSDLGDINYQILRQLSQMPAQAVIEYVSTNPKDKLQGENPDTIGYGIKEEKVSQDYWSDLDRFASIDRTLNLQGYHTDVKTSEHTYNIPIYDDNGDEICTEERTLIDKTYHVESIVQEGIGQVVDVNYFPNAPGPVATIATSPNQANNFHIMGHPEKGQYVKFIAFHAADFEFPLDSELKIDDIYEKVRAEESRVKLLKLVFCNLPQGKEFSLQNLEEKFTFNCVPLQMPEQE